MEEYEEEAVFQHSVHEFVGTVIKVQPFGQSLNAGHRAASSIEDDICEWSRCNPTAMDSNSVDDDDGGVASAV